MDIQGVVHPFTVSEQESPFQQQLRRNAEETGKTLGGIYGAAPYTAIPAFVAIPITLIGGEGDYIFAVLAGLYAALFGYGVRRHRAAEKGSSRRSRELWIALYSFFLASTFAAVAIVSLFAPGGWRYVS